MYESSYTLQILTDYGEDERRDVNDNIHVHFEVD